MAKHDHQRGWMPGGPLVHEDWLKMPPFVQRWYSSAGRVPLTPLSVGFRWPGGTAPIRSDGTRAQLPEVVPEPQQTQQSPSDTAYIPPRIPVVPSGPVVAQAETKGDPEVAITWQQGLQTGIDLLNTWGNMTSGDIQQAWAGPQQFVAATPPPGKVTVDTKTGKVTACKRKRRRVILTQSDLGVLFQISTLPNNANVRTALARSIRR